MGERNLTETESFSVLDILSTEEDKAPYIDGVVVGVIKSIDQKSALPLVDFIANDSGRDVLAKSTVPVTHSEVGREVALLFEQGNPRKPIIIGLMWAPSTEVDQTVEIKQDQERLVLKAEREIELRCGKASIILTKAGKVLIKGDYVLSRSSGVNQIKGGSVQIN